jgi:thioredoxin 1
MSIELDSGIFERFIKDAKLPVLVDFWAEWCRPCLAMAPILEEIATEKEGSLIVAKIDIDFNPGIGQLYKIMTLPTLILFSNGEIIKREVGAKGKTQILAMLD